MGKPELESLTDLERDLLKLACGLLSVNGHARATWFADGIAKDGTLDRVAEKTGFYLEDYFDLRICQRYLKENHASQWE